MTDAEIKATVEREQRTDRAERTLTVEGADITYVYEERAWTKRAGERIERRWRVESVRLVWDRGVLTTVKAYGHRYKKDGTVGQIRENAYWRVSALGNGAGLKLEIDRLMSATPVPAWLPGLVAGHMDVPPFKGLAEVGA